MKNNLAKTLTTIKFFLLSMMMLSVLMSVLVCWVIFKVIQNLPDNGAEGIKVEEIQTLSGDVQKIYGDCLSGVDWAKLAKGDIERKTGECLQKAKETESYKRLKAVYEVEVLPVIN